MNPLAGLASILQGRGRPNPLAGNPLDYQAMLDNAPVGSVGAPSGVMPNPSRASNRDPAQNLLDASAMAPVIGDVMGPIADIRRFQQNPETRTLGNALMFGAGLLPLVPSLGFLMSQGGNAARRVTPFSKEAGIIGYHGSPHKFDAFDMSKIGTGEGAQAYGHGLYFAESPEVAKGYSRAVTTQRLGLGTIADKPMSELSSAEKGALIELKLAGGDVSKAIAKLKQLGPEYAKNVSERLPILEEIAAGNKSAELAKGNLYTVDIPDEHIDKMLDWDKPLSEQPRPIYDVFRKAYMDKQITVDPNKASIGEMLQEWYRNMGSASDVTRHLAESGITGIKYLDAGSRGAGSGTRNFVVFDDKIPKILKRE